jgi:AAA domain, putative AbiEii toxin, Type IV TA system
MFLKKLQYYELRNTPQSWEIDEFDLQKVNLIVGKNAAGKTRTLNAIEGFANLLFTSQKIIFNNGYYHGYFENKNDELELEIEIQDGIVNKELLKHNNITLIDRKSDGTGLMMNSKVNSMIEFKIPNNELISNRRDEIQFPYLEQIYNWAEMVRRFHFTFERIKTLAVIESNTPKQNEFNLKDTEKAVSIFSRGFKKFGQAFSDQIIKDFNNVGYSITELSLGDLVSVKIESPAPGTRIQGLRVKETDREGITDQHAMSAGMFRALSVIIHFVYYEFEKLAGCILIDDIGEGLDFERATNLIKLLIQKAESTEIQLIMSSNDKFVMNNTDLKYWQIIFREGGRVHFYNQKNSPKIFADFKFTGLNNFDFFIMDFFKTGFSEENTIK